MTTNFNKRYEVGPIQYGYLQAAKTWQFTFEREGRQNTFLMPAGGKDKAEKIARILVGAIKRTGQVDNLARANIERITA